MNFRKATEKDVTLITSIMTEAFNYDTTLHRTDLKEDGPLGYNDGSLAKQMVLNKQQKTYLIVIEDEVIGFVNFRSEEAKGILEKFCIKAEYIGKGFGKQAWWLLEKMAAFDTWQLETPDYSIRNHHFYEKCGFQKIGQKKYGENSYSFVFEKKITIE